MKVIRGWVGLRTIVITALGMGCAGPRTEFAHQEMAMPPVEDGAIPAKTGILVMAHGGDSKWDQDVLAVVEPLRARYDVEVAFGMARTSTLREATRRLEERGVRQIAVVRMFISGESFLPETEYILGKRADPPPTPPWAMAAGDDHHCMEKPEQIQTQAFFQLSREGVADSPLVDEILLERARNLSMNPAWESVLVLAHGPADDAENERWLEKMRARTQRVATSGGFKEVRCETLREDWPEKRAPAEARIRGFVQAATERGDRVIVIPFRVAGFGPYQEVLEGLSYASDGRGFCPHPQMTRWIEQRAKECFAAMRTSSLLD